MTNGIQAAVVEWIRALDLEIISLLLSRAWPLALLTTTELRWRPTVLTDTDNVVRLDRRQRLVRWDRRPPNEIFLEGFVPIVTREDPDWEETDLYGFAKNNHPSIFVSTTKTQRNKNKYVWTPRNSNRGIIYQYEIYAPGGVDVNDSFSDASPWPNQMEVAFPGGIQNIYIRSARELHNGRVQRIWINPNFLDPGDLEPVVSSSRTLQVIWRVNHPDGGNKAGRSERSTSSYDDLMYGGISQLQWRPIEVTDADDVVRLDRRQRLLRWDRRPPNEIFLEGFVPIVIRDNPDWEETDLYGFVKNNHPSIFVSTTKTQRNKKNRGPPNPITNGIQAAVLEWIISLDLELISLLLSRSWPMPILDISEPRWRPTELTDTDNVVRRPPNEIFLEGFVPIVTRENPDWEETDMYGFAKNNHPSVFVSTTKKKKKNVWTPRSASPGIVYQYEIYAPGGVDVNESLLQESP
ncbi:unnamed protein product [Pieris brassicae]|uniref:Pierisin-like domain-containing protein n=1 Tax=Pieris brassicae TaxID=7116 RepID=A0A9P0T8A9_PIEBR|nr:unnamed protein product [Pieris brassicae]